MPTGADQKAYDFVRQNCFRIIKRLEQLATSYDKLLQEDGIALSNTIKALEQAPFEDARSRIRTRLISIAVCGAFSSGKSFLISALIDQVMWYPEQKPDEVLDQQIDRYTTLLPTSPQQTNSCPLAIIPWPSAKHLQVVFDDTNTWEDKTDATMSDEEISRRILAYATDWEEGRAWRSAGDRARNVVRARLLVGQMPMPAVIYDLPGIGGIGEAYLKQVHEALRAADVIVYVASAIKELTDAEFELLRFVEEIAEQDKTPIIFVLAQTDREPDWERILEKDNEFLTRLFVQNGAPRMDLIGKGFVPVSAAGEAKAKGLFQAGKLTEAERDRAIDQSGMPVLRTALDEILTTQAGPVHMREILMQMYALLKDIRDHVESRIQAKSLPLADAEKRMQESRALVKALTDKSKSLADDLDRVGQAVIATALACSNPDDLHAMLVEQAVPLIQKLDVTKDAEKDKVQQAIKRVRDDWLLRPEAGFTARWAKAWDRYQRQALTSLQDCVSQAAEEAAVSFPVSVGRFAPEEDESIRAMKVDLHGVTVARRISAGVTGLGIGGVALGTMALGGAAMAVAPVGLALIGLGAAGMGLSTLKQRSDRARLRGQLINYLPKYSNQVVTQLEFQARDQIGFQRGEVVRVVEQLISVQKDSITVLESRLQAGDLKASREQIKTLNEMLEECRKIERAILNPRIWMQ